ncbi:MAG TPA: ion transporter [Ferruginibacter sp.]|nr:ion transporter [Ferruginibacter sp.]HRO16687.1 ion transporter [Ferruginibacter sp.]HRQ19691.1 ion transporter [Ferruginibacter sp.]
MNQRNPIPPHTTPGWKNNLRTIIFGTDTANGKLFDVCLLVAIVLSILIVMIDSIPSIHAKIGQQLLILEWALTILFTIEYILRIISVTRPMRYVFSLMGIIDLLAILPMYLSFFFIGSQSLIVFRALRLLRVFRIFKLNHFITEMNFLILAFLRSLKKISIFMLFVLTLLIILGSIMYVIESQTNGFNSIPDSIYWAIVTITTVGYGDITPITPLGKFVSSVIMLLGYSIIAVPTGIITSEMAAMHRRRAEIYKPCSGCGKTAHASDAMYCTRCGQKLPD